MKNVVSCVSLSKEKILSLTFASAASSFLSEQNLLRQRARRAQNSLLLGIWNVDKYRQYSAGFWYPHPVLGASVLRTVRP